LVLQNFHLLPEIIQLIIYRLAYRTIHRVTSLGNRDFLWHRILRQRISRSHGFNIVIGKRLAQRGIKFNNSGKDDSLIFTTTLHDTIISYLMEQVPTKAKQKNLEKYSLRHLSMGSAGRRSTRRIYNCNHLLRVLLGALQESCHGILGSAAAGAHSIPVYFFSTSHGQSNRDLHTCFCGSPTIIEGRILISSENFGQGLKFLGCFRFREEMFEQTVEGSAGVRQPIACQPAVHLQKG